METEQFTINTEDVVKKEILVYRRVKGDVCYEYIDTLAENARWLALDISLKISTFLNFLEFQKQREFFILYIRMFVQ